MQPLCDVMLSISLHFFFVYFLLFFAIKEVYNRTVQKQNHKYLCFMFFVLLYCTREIRKTLFCLHIQFLLFHLEEGESHFFMLKYIVLPTLFVTSVFAFKDKFKFRVTRTHTHTQWIEDELYTDVVRCNQTHTRS